jgi:hypothetical protein
MKIIYILKLFLCALVLYSNFIYAQEINNNLHGYYETKSEASMFPNSPRFKPTVYPHLFY